MSPHPGPPGRDVHNGDELLIVAARLVRSRRDEILAPLGLTLAAVLALEGIALRPIGQEQLATVLRVSTQTLGRLLARLESAGLLTRTRNPMDRRQRTLQLTPAGEKALTAARQSEATISQGGLDIENWTVLQAELARFVASLEASQSVSTAPRPPPARWTSSPGARQPIRPGEEASDSTDPGRGLTGRTAVSGPENPRPP